MLVGIPVFAAMIAFNKAMIELKPAIPKINAFSWDEWMMQADRVLHFGVDPWVLLQPLLGHDLVTFAINVAYNFWFVILGGAWFWFGFQCRSNELRTRFFLCLHAVLVGWRRLAGRCLLIGRACLLCARSAFRLIPTSRSWPISPMSIRGCRSGCWMPSSCCGTVIPARRMQSASRPFPSMHNASALIFALAFAQVSRKLGWFFYGYAAVILAGLRPLRLALCGRWLCRACHCLGLLGGGGRGCTLA